MALQQDITDSRFGYLAKNAYIKFAYLRWSDVDKRTVATFSIFASKEALESGKEVIENIEIDVTGSFPNIQSQIYAKIKSMPDFASAIDV